MFLSKMMGNGCGNSLRIMFAGSQVPRPLGRENLSLYLLAATQLYPMSVLEITLHSVQSCTQLETRKEWSLGMVRKRQVGTYL